MLQQAGKHFKEEQMADTGKKEQDRKTVVYGYLVQQVEELRRKEKRSFANAMNLALEKGLDTMRREL